MYKKEIAKTLKALSGSRSPYQVFSDWVECCALAIQNSCYIQHNQLWKQRESRYIQCIQPYGAEGERFSDMFYMLVEAMGKNIEDVLGAVYMEAGLGNKNTGQFFTPFSLSYMCARMQYQDADGKQPISVYEPAAGAGGMVIAAAKVLHEKGINYQKHMRVTAQELDWKGVYMCYVQLSILGIDAVVIQGDTLTEPYAGKGYPPGRVFRTPRRMGMLVWNM